MELTSKYELVSFFAKQNQTHLFGFSGTFLSVRLVHCNRHHYFHYRNLSNEIEIKIYRFSIFADMTWHGTVFVYWQQIMFDVFSLSQCVNVMQSCSLGAAVTNIMIEF